GRTSRARLTQIGHPAIKRASRTWSLKPAPSIGTLLLGVTRTALTPATRMPVTCSNACLLTQGSRAALAYIDRFGADNTASHGLRAFALQLWTTVQDFVAFCRRILRREARP